MNHLVNTIQAYSDSYESGEPVQSRYFSQELLKAAKSLTGKPLVHTRSFPNKKEAVVMWSAGPISYCLLHRVLLTRDKVAALCCLESSEDSTINPFLLLYSGSKSAMAEDLRSKTKGKNVTFPRFCYPENKIADKLYPLYLVARGLDLGSRIYLGHTKGRTHVRFRSLAASMGAAYLGQAIDLHTPYVEKTQVEVIQEYLESGGLGEALWETVSCSKWRTSNPVHCGECEGCYRRFKLWEHFRWKQDFVTYPWEAKDFKRYEREWYSQ